MWNEEKMYVSILYLSYAWGFDSFRYTTPTYNVINLKDK